MVVIRYTCTLNARTELPWFTLPTVALPDEAPDTVNGRFVQSNPPAAQEIDVDPAKLHVKITTRPILVYVPLELNVPTTTNPGPWFGVHVPSSYCVKILPPFALKSMPLPAAGERIWSMVALFVDPLWTIGTTSVPARAVAAGSADIFLSAIVYSLSR